MLTRSQIYERVWGYDFGDSSNALWVYIGYLRRKLEEGDDILNWAVRRARERPYSTSPCPGEKYALVASIAYHLAERTRPRPFLLPCKRLAPLRGTSAMTVINIIGSFANEELVGEALAPFREDGVTYGTPTWIWSVAVDNALYVRGRSDAR